MRKILHKEIKNDLDYKNCISDLIENKEVLKLHQFVQHANVSRLEHCLLVSYESYLWCRKFGLDYRSAARGGLLHDFFLYDRRVEKPYRGFHGFVHPKIALDNAQKHFSLNDKEIDIIIKHMWPLTIEPPKYVESFIVSCVDKYCASLEFAKMNNQESLFYLKQIAKI